jgi:hypothetical protein
MNLRYLKYNQPNLVSLRTYVLYSIYVCINHNIVHFQEYCKNIFYIKQLIIHHITSTFLSRNFWLQFDSIPAYGLFRYTRYKPCQALIRFPPSVRLYVSSQTSGRTGGCTWRLNVRGFTKILRYFGILVKMGQALPTLDMITYTHFRAYNK